MSMILDSEKLNPQYNQNSVLTMPWIACGGVPEPPDFPGYGPAFPLPPISISSPFPMFAYPLSLPFPSLPFPSLSPHFPPFPLPPFP